MEVYPDLSVHMKKLPISWLSILFTHMFNCDTWLILITSFTKLKLALDMLLHFLKGSAITHKRDKILTFPKNLLFLFN